MKNESVKTCLVTYLYLITDMYQRTSCLQKTTYNIVNFRESGWNVNAHAQWDSLRLCFSIRRLRPKKSMTKKRSERRAIKFSKSECFMIINFSLKGKLSNLCFPLIFLLQKKLSFFFTNWWKPLFEFMTTQTPGLIIFLFLIAFIR